MDPKRRLRGPTAVLLLAGTIALGSAMPGISQGMDCDGLRGAIAALRGGDGNQASRYARSARRQQAEIDRTLAYRRSLGCDSRQFLVFGDQPPPKCGRIDAQIERMNENLAALQQSQARIAEGDPGERAELLQRYDAYCRDNGRFATASPRGYPDDTYPPNDLPPPGAGFRRMPLDPPTDEPLGPDEARSPDPPEPTDTGTVVGGAKAVCVKTCDGSFFPVSYSTSRGDLASLEAMCHATCPNAETKVYTYDITTEITQAVDKQGVSYAELPTANRYAKIHDASCSCRAPGKSWLETLAEAERLYAGGKHDIVVTQQMSDALARAAPAAASKVASRSRRGRSTQAAADAGTAADKAATVATDDASGLRGTGEVGAAADAKRRVRVIAPNL